MSGAEADRVLVGASRVDVTPPLSVPYLGFEPRQASFTGVHDALEARAAVFRAADASACILSVDAIGIDNRMLGPGRSFVGELRRRVEERCGVPGSHVMLASTHAHSTPETLGITRSWELEAARRWAEELLDRLAAVAASAASSAVPCTLKVGSSALLGVGHNRRPNARGLSLEEQAARGLLDPELLLLVAEDEAGAARCVLLNYACHAVTVQVQPLISADYPGVACRLLEERLPGRPACLFLQGAAGNVNPLRDDTRDFRDVELHGLAVGGAALELAARLMGDAGAAFRTPRIRAARAEVTLPPRELPPRAELERLAVPEALDLAERFSMPQQAEIQALRLGELALAASPGEMFTQWGLGIKRSSPASRTMVVELANGWVGYLLSPGSFAEGGYETGLGTWTQTTEEGARLVAAGLERLLRELWS